MSDARADEPPPEATDDMQAEYHFDYAEARPNRFAASFPPGGRLVALDPDIARVFTTAEAVNSVLRAVESPFGPGSRGSA
jgi:hypothetical protein